MIGRLWRGTSEEDKAEFKLLGEEDQERYHRQNDELTRFGFCYDEYGQVVMRSRPVIKRSQTPEKKRRPPSQGKPVRKKSSRRMTTQTNDRPRS
jgi:hypothetical protein